MLCFVLSVVQRQSGRGPRPRWDVRTSPYKQSQKAVAGSRLEDRGTNKPNFHGPDGWTQGPGCTNKPNWEGPAAWSDTAMNKQSQLGEARLVSGGRLCETKPICAVTKEDSVSYVPVFRRRR
jgi:hypothetical protein